MYCPACGAETKEGLRYCNRCGANLIAERAAPPPRLFTLIVVLSVVLLVALLIGFSIIFLFGVETVSRGNSEPFGFLFLTSLALVVLGVAWLITRQIGRLISAYLSTSETKVQPKIQTKPAAENLRPEISTHQTAPNLPPASTIPIDAEQLTRKLETEK